MVSIIVSAVARFCYCSAMLTARLATMADAMKLFEWRNLPAVRAMCRSPEEVAWADHLGWLERSLVNPSRRIFMCDLDGVSVATFRYDYGDAAELSWNVAPGIAGLDVRRRMAEFAGAHHHGAMVAYVRPSNFVTQRLLTQIGFQKVAAGEFDEWRRPALALAA